MSAADAAPGARARRRAERRRTLLDAAMGIVVAEGAEALTIARVAEQMGASVGGLYRYYPSKEAILVALQERAIEDLEGFLADREAPRGAPPLARVRAALVGYLDHAAARPEVHELILASLSGSRAQLSDDGARAVDKRIAPLLQRLAQWLAQAAASGELAPGDALQRVYVLWAAVHGLDHFRRRDRILSERLRTRALLQVAVDGLLSGWGAPRDIV